MRGHCTCLAWHYLASSCRYLSRVNKPNGIGQPLASPLNILNKELCKTEKVQLTTTLLFIITCWAIPSSVKHWAFSSLSLAFFSFFIIANFISSLFFFFFFFYLSIPSHFYFPPSFIHSFRRLLFLILFSSRWMGGKRAREWLDSGSCCHLAVDFASTWK